MPEKKLKYLDAHHRQFIALAVGIIAWFIARQLFLPNHIIVTWIAYAGAIISMDWIFILSMHPKQVKKNAKLEDSSITLIFLFIIAAAFISLLAVVMLLVSTKGKSPQQTTEHALLAIGSVAVSWWLTHTVFTLRYAHLYYGDNDGIEGYDGGLEFPKEPEPDYMDFVYFSFVVGMTFQVSDVEISSRKIRRLAWAHGILSFVFNTVIVALSINIISGLFGH